MGQSSDDAKSAVLHAAISGILPLDFECGGGDFSMLTFYSAIQRASADRFQGKFFQFGCMQHAFQVRP
jgi:hypothetical protein